MHHEKTPMAAHPHARRHLDHGSLGDDDAAVFTLRLPFVVACLFAGACAHQPTAELAPEARGPARPIPGAPIVALQGVDAPGFNIDDLTARLRESLVYSSGAPFVDEASVRAEIAACIEMPCPDTQQQLFRDATLVAGASLAKVGANTVLGSLRISKGLKEVVRVNAQGKDAATVATTLGRLGGEALREVLTTTVAAPTEAPAAER